MEIMWKSTEAISNCLKLYENFHTRKLGEITVFFAVDSIVRYVTYFKITEIGLSYLINIILILISTLTLTITPILTLKWSGKLLVHHAFSVTTEFINTILLARSLELEDILLLGPLKHFHVNSLQPQISQDGYLLLAKKYSNGDFCKVV